MDPLSVLFDLNLVYQTHTSVIATADVARKALFVLGRKCAVLQILLDRLWSPASNIDSSVVAMLLTSKSKGRPYTLYFES